MPSRPSVPVMAPGMSSSPGCDSDSARKRGREQGGDDADRDVDQEGQAPAARLEAEELGSRPVSQPPRIRPTAAPAPDMAA